MKQCKRCKKEIDSKASKCPFCQSDLRNWFAKHPILTGILVLIVIGIVASAGNSGKKVGENSKTPETTTTSTGQTEQKQDVKEESFKIGDKIQLGKVILTVNKVETSSGAQFTKPSEGNQWVDVNMTIENTGSTQEYITTMGQMYILDKDNNQYQVTVTGKRLENAGSTGLDGAIVAKAKKTDWVGFEVRKTATGLKFQYNASMFSDKKILVDLGM